MGRYRKSSRYPIKPELSEKLVGSNGSFVVQKKLTESTLNDDPLKNHLY